MSKIGNIVSKKEKNTTEMNGHKKSHPTSILFEFAQKNSQNLCQ